MSDKLEIDRVAGPGSVWIETSDIDAVSPSRDGQHAAAVTVRWRSQYQEAGAFEAKGSLLRLHLLPRQVRHAVEQLRDAQEGYCNGEGEAGCYDYGKVSAPPAACVRCLLIDACRRSRQGDLRRASPPVTYGHGHGLVFCFCVLMVLWVWTLQRWSAAAVELQACQAARSPVGKNVTKW